MSSDQQICADGSRPRPVSDGLIRTDSQRQADTSMPAHAPWRDATAPWRAADMGGAHSDSPRGGRKPRRYALALTLLLLAGCQSAPTLLQPGAAGTEAADAALARSLTASIDAIAQSLDRPETLARSEARHRQLLASHLPLLLDEATPPRTIRGMAQKDALLDPAELTQITPVTRPRSKPAGLERAGIGLPVVAKLSAPGDPNAPRAGYHLPATLVVQPGNPSRRQGAAALPIQPAMQKPRTSPVATPLATPVATPVATHHPPRSRTACCESDLVNPKAVAQVATASGPLPIAMDLYAPLRATKAMGVRPMAAIANLVRPGHFTGEPRIIFLQPFDPDKIPVVLVHGLLSTPGVWEPLVTQLLADPAIRDCCQLWFFYYPTGQPVPLSALQFREALNDAVAHTGLRQKMILIGHSMGGILSRAQVSRMSPAVAETIMPGVSELSDYNRVRRALIFEPRTNVSRVVFLFVPHRGSRLAANSLGALAVRLIRLPDALLNEAEHAANQLAGLESRRIPTSIHGLSPRSPFLRALSNTTPVVPVHSIIGNRGRGDGSAGSDGVVPVRSARVTSAESELIVPTGHGGFDHPAAVAEIRHIILMDVAQQQRSAAARGLGQEDIP